MAENSLNVIIKLTDNASAGLKSFADWVDKTWDKINNTTQSAQTFTKVVTGVGAVVGWYAVKTFMDFEKTMSGVKAVLAPTTEEFWALQSKVKQLGADTVFSQGEIARATEELAKNGLNTAQILWGALDATANFASAAGTDLTNAGTIMSDAMNIFRLSAGDAAKAVDQMTGVTVVSKFGAQDYALALAQGGAAAKVAWVSFEDFNTSIAAISNWFASGSDAGTSFKTFMQRLVPQSDAAAAAMEKLWFNAFDASGALRPMSEIAGNLKKSLAWLTDEQRNQALTTIFWSDALRAAAMLAETGAEWFDKLGESIGKVNAAEQAATRLDNLSGSFERLKGTVDVMMTNLGATIGEKLRPAIDGLNNALSTMWDWWKSLSPEMQGAITTIGAIVAVLAGLVFAIGAVGIVIWPVLGAFSAAAWAIAFLVSPIGLLIAALSALWAAYATNFMWFRDTVNSVFAAAKPLFDVFIATMSVFVAQVVAYINLLKEPFMTIWETIKPAVMWFLEIFWTAFKETFDNIITVLSWAWQIISGLFQIWFNVVVWLFTVFLDVLTGNWSWAWEAMKTMLFWVWEWIKLVFSGAFTVLEWIFKQFITNMKLTFGLFWEALKTIVTVWWTWIKWVVTDMWNGMKLLFTDGDKMIAWIWTWFTNGLKSAMEWAWNGIKSTIASGINWMIEKINKLIESINSAAGGVGVNINKIQPVTFQTWWIVPWFGSYQSGGIISGGKNPASHDKIPAMLDPGELILNRAQQGNLAEQMKASWNQSSAPTMIVQVTGNSFYGSDSDFAEKVGDAIFEKFNVHQALPWF